MPVSLLYGVTNTAKLVKWFVLHIVTPDSTVVVIPVDSQLVPFNDTQTKCTPP